MRLVLLALILVAVSLAVFQFAQTKETKKIASFSLPEEFREYFGRSSGYYSDFSRTIPSFSIPAQMSDQEIAVVEKGADRFSQTNVQIC